MNAWGVLKQAVKDAPAGATIKITGTIQAATASGNNGELEITKDLTIKPKSGTATLDANSSALGSNAHRIFKVILNCTTWFYKAAMQEKMRAAVFM